MTWAEDELSRPVPGYGVVRFRLGDEQDREACYPAVDLYQFQEFAGPVFELGGYGDMTLIDHYTGRRLWMAPERANDGHVMPGDPVLTEMSVYDQMARLIALAKEIDFMGENAARE
jgi:hypothetical protein